MRSEREIRERLGVITEALDNSRKHPVVTLEDRNHDEYFHRFEERTKQMDQEIDWIREIHTLEWVLGER